MFCVLDYLVNMASFDGVQLAVVSLCDEKQLRIIKFMRLPDVLYWECKLYTELILIHCCNMHVWFPYFEKETIYMFYSHTKTVLNIMQNTLHGR